MIKIYGASDDLIEVDGDIEEEWGIYDDEQRYLAFSDGTVVSIYYDQEGIWRVHTIARGKAEQSHTLPTEDAYTEVLELTGVPILWVVMGKDYASYNKVKKEGSEEIA